MDMDTKMILNPTTQDQSSSSAQIVMSNEDLLTEILLRTPIGSLMGIKLVSKQWYSLITNPNFSLERSTKPTSAVGFLFNNYEFCSNGIFEFIPFSLQNPASPQRFIKLKFTNSPYVAIEQSCNGLLLCSTFPLPPYHHISNRSRKRRYYICNPTTKKYFLLPEANGIGTMSLAFDPAKSPHYKVVRVSKLKYSTASQYQIWVYSSDVGFWRIIGNTSNQVGSENIVYWNGAIHWIKYGGGSHYFNVDEETLHSMQMPPCPAHGYLRNGNCLVESCDHLYYVEIFDQAIEFDIYEMRRDRYEWFVKYHVDLSPIIDVYPEVTRDHLNPICQFSTMVRGERDEDSFLILLIPGNFIRYYFVKNTYETLCELDIDEAETRLKIRNIRGFHFIESLCSV